MSGPGAGRCWWSPTRWRKIPSGGQRRWTTTWASPGRTGAELLTAMRRHAESAGAEFLTGRALSGRPDGGYLVCQRGPGDVQCPGRGAGGRRGPGAEASRRGGASGPGRQLLRHLRRHALRGRAVAVLGYSDTARQEAEFLRGIGCAVTYFDRPCTCEIRGTDHVTGVVCDGRSAEAEGVFILRPTVAPADLFPGLTVEGGHVAVDRRMATDLPASSPQGTAPADRSRCPRPSARGSSPARAPWAWVSARSGTAGERKTIFRFQK